MAKSSTPKKRSASSSSLSVFDSIQKLNFQDQQAESKRRKRTRIDAKRAKAAQSQSKVYEHLVECRILLQRVWTSSTTKNESKKDSIVQDEDEATSNTEGTTAVNELDSLVLHLLEARQTLLTGMQLKRKKQQEDHDDAATTSKEGYKDLILKSDTQQQQQQFQTVLEQEYETFRKYWKDVLNRRQEELKLSSGITAKQSQFKILNSSFWDQVESTVEYEQQQQRLHHHHQQQQNEGDEDDNSTMSFEDSKMYQQLLKDFVLTSGRKDSMDGLLSKKQRKRQQQQQQRKSNVDRKASKGRKIRYQEIPKLVHFTFPLPKQSGGINNNYNNNNIINNRNNDTTIALEEEEWFASLFGGVGNTTTSNHTF